MNPRLHAQHLTNQAVGIVEQGLQAESQGKFEVARLFFEQALQPLAMAVEADPTYDHAHNEQAFVLGRLGRTSEAAESARKAISLAPHIPKFRMALIGIGLKEIGLRKSREERTRSAETYRNAIAEVIDKFPRYPSGFLAQAELFALTGAGQSLWEDCLSKAATAYFGMKRMSLGTPATEAAVAEALKRSIMKCSELAREWVRLRD